MGGVQPWGGGLGTGVRGDLCGGNGRAGVSWFSKFHHLDQAAHAPCLVLYSQALQLSGWICLLWEKTYLSILMSF